MTRTMHPHFGFDATPTPEACPNLVVAEPQVGGLDRGQIYVPQSQATNMEAKLRDPKLQAVVRIRLRDDGHITPLRMTFRPKPPEPGTAK